MAYQDQRGSKDPTRSLDASGYHFVILVDQWIEELFPVYHVGREKERLYFLEKGYAHGAEYRKKNDDAHSGHDRPDGVLCKNGKEETQCRHR